MGYRLGNLVFDGGVGYVTTSGDTIREFTAEKARPGLIYQVRYVNKKGSVSPIIQTLAESGELKAGQHYLVSPTSDLGLQIDSTFGSSYRNVPITTDYSQMPAIKRLLYRTFGYGAGGVMNYFNYFSR